MASPTPNVKEFDPNDEILDELEISLSAYWFGTFLTATGGDRTNAVNLCTWNTAISAAFFGPLQALEIALRNAMNRELAAVHGKAWYDKSKTGNPAL